jgi:alkylresorcinol/alkylpyrone synthase
MEPLPRLLALATAVPPFVIDQAEAAARAQQLLGRSVDLDRLMPVFTTSGIKTRYSAVPLDWFDTPRGWAERNERYLAAALDLLETIAGRLLDRGGIGPEEIGSIVTVSTTGIATPSLDALLIERMNLPRSLQRLPIFGLGCAGGTLGLARAAALARARPDKAVLFLVVELCTLCFRHGDTTKSNIVASALFADGAAGALLRCGTDGIAVAAAGEHLWPHSLDIMGWEVTESGLKARFSRDIPRLVAAEFGAVTRKFLSGEGLRLDEVDLFVPHPGGPKVVDACEQAFGLAAGALDVARGVLREFGNMSAASVMFVLEQELAQAPNRKTPWRRALMTALGPGFTAAFTVLAQR